MNSLVLRILLLVALLLPASAAAQSVSPTFIPTQHNEATVAQLQAEMASGALTSERLTQEYITRILALDQNGPGRTCDGAERGRAAEARRGARAIARHTGAAEGQHRHR